MPLKFMPALTRLSALLSLPLFAMVANAQFVSQSPGTDASFRGMSIVGADAIWISGTKGTFAWTTDGGAEWHAGHVAGAESYDFRAVHAISIDTAVMMISLQDTALIYRTTDRGANWKVQYRNATKGAFLDGMAFFDSHRGLAVGDPMGGRFVILETNDGGQSWSRIPDAGLPPALPGDGAFAASGTSLITCGPNDAWLGSGGAARSRVFHSTDRGRTWTVADVPIKAGSASAGIFSLACRDTKHLIAVGGNYARPDASVATVATSDDGGLHWTASAPAPSTGFLSGVAYVTPADGLKVIAVGTEGTAFSVDGGKSWSSLDARSLNVVMARPGGGKVWAAGGKGSVAVLTGLVPMQQ
jgi:photosystem II stability/assembly factor-like uncharacterized protein